MLPAVVQSLLTRGIFCFIFFIPSIFHPAGAAVASAPLLSARALLQRKLLLDRVCNCAQVVRAGSRLHIKK